MTRKVIEENNVTQEIPEVDQTNQIKLLPQEQLNMIKKGVLEIISEEELLIKLQRSYELQKPLIIKFGLDPSAPDIHLGHTVLLRKIRQFQDLGHHVVIIIGDFSGRIGDPTGRSKVRQQLSEEQVKVNAQTYMIQILEILDPQKVEIRFNSEWLKRLTFEDVINLTSKVTVARILERDDFSNRYKNKQAIGLHEFLYPLIQAYDSVYTKADIELGGTDQTFNILMGRVLQKEYGIESQVAIFMPILEGIDGVQKMSKSLGNYIGVQEPPEQMYRKVMLIPDDLIIRYFELVTDVHPDEIARYKEELEEGFVNPRDIKMSLACEITSLYHGISAAENAERRFQTIYQQNQIPKDIEEFSVAKAKDHVGIVIKKDNDSVQLDLPTLICSLRFAISKSEARRLLCQNAVKIDQEKYCELLLTTSKETFILSVGKNKMARIRVK